MSRNISITIKVLLLGATVLVSACAGKQKLQSEADPFENFNRKVYDFNERSDRLVLKPVAAGYEKVVPAIARQGVNNFFSNLGNLLAASNALLQVDIGSAATSIGRFVINSTVGIVGLADVATPMGLEKQNKDFGQTLAFWGVPSGPYLVLPVFGPSTVRDSSNIVFNGYNDPLKEAGSPARYYAKILDLVDKRSQLLGLEDALAVQPDGYLFIKNLYQQNRNNIIFEGDVPQDPNKTSSDDLIDELLDAS